MIKSDKIENTKNFRISVAPMMGQPETIVFLHDYLIPILCCIPKW